MKTIPTRSIDGRRGSELDVLKCGGEQRQLINVA
jgi:hypothetical protein